MSNQFHVVSFQVPYPPNYGGVIDVFFRLKALKEAGVSFVLHTFQYDNRETSELLSSFADKVYYYERDVTLMNQCSLLPYIVKTRKNKQLLDRLCVDDAPIWFEGLHTTAWLTHPRLKGRKLYVRMHNIEAAYYLNLAKASSTIKEKLFFLLEAFRLNRYEKVLASSDGIFAISTIEQSYFKDKYPQVHSFLMPAFHAEKKGTSKQKGQGDYILYHGNLQVAENQKAVDFLLKELAPKLTIPLYIAGTGASRFAKQASGFELVHLFDTITTDKLNHLIEQAKANILITFQATGLKLKLLHAMEYGGFCIVNTPMVEGSSLGENCLIADTAEALLEVINGLDKLHWDEAFDVARTRALLPFSNKENCKVLLQVLNNSDK